MSILLVCGSGAEGEVEAEEVGKGRGGGAGDIVGSISAIGDGGGAVGAVYGGCAAAFQGDRRVVGGCGFEEEGGEGRWEGAEAKEGNVV